MQTIFLLSAIVGNGIAILLLLRNFNLRDVDGTIIMTFVILTFLSSISVIVQKSEWFSSLQNKYAEAGISIASLLIIAIALYWPIVHRDIVHWQQNDIYIPFIIAILLIFLYARLLFANNDKYLKVRDFLLFVANSIFLVFTILLAQHEGDTEAIKYILLSILSAMNLYYVTKNNERERIFIKSLLMFFGPVICTFAGFVIWGLLSQPF